MKSKTLTVSIITTLAITSALFAKDVNLDTIVVSSDFREQTLSQTSANVSVITEEDIYNRASESFENIIGQTPNVNFTSGASRAHYIQIRGIGERSQFKAPVNPSVGLIIDGMDFSQSALGVTLFDVSQVEVLKGPQGTTFGANGLAGVVSLQSNQPTKETEAHIEATIGNYNKQAFGAAVGGTLLKDKLLGRFSIYKNSNDGFMDNSFLNREDTSDIDELTTKGQLKWLVNDKHTIDLNLIHVDVDNGYDDFTLDNTRDSHADEPGKDRQKTDALSLKSTYQINSKMHLESTISASKSDLEYGYDEDWSYVGEFTESLYPYSSFDQYLRDRKQIDFDIRLISDKEGRIFSNSTDWTVGAYLKNFSEDLTRNYTYLDSPYTSEYETQNLAVYGQLDKHLDDKFTVVTGLRVEKWDAEYSDSDNFSIDTDEVLVGGKLGLEYRQNDKSLFYTTLSRGYKPGGVNADNSLSIEAIDYETETLWNLDVGLNSDHLDDKLQSRINFFYGQRRDQQVKSSIAQPRDDGSVKFTDYLANAAKSHYFGLESELDFYPMENLHLFSNIGLLQAEFDEYVDPNPDAYDAEGREPAQSPKYQYNLGFDYIFADAWMFKADVEGRGSYFFSNRHDAKSDSYNLMNSSLSYSTGQWSASLWGRNLSDEDYQVRGFGSFGNNPSKLYATETYTQLGSPRTFGLTISYDY
ncbi:MAG TPA: TonB-dependent receptor [Campylobacterales bacterium]|nr:TonB-dependent receptor [Campylobacterales bacterium]